MNIRRDQMLFIGFVIGLNRNGLTQKIIRFLIDHLFVLIIYDPMIGKVGDLGQLAVIPNCGTLTVKNVVLARIILYTAQHIAPPHRSLEAQDFAFHKLQIRNGVFRSLPDGSGKAFCFNAKVKHSFTSFFS